jgi:hypothetical protein
VGRTKEERNNILQKAIALYIGELGDLKLSESQLSFMAVKENSTFNDDTYEKEYGSTVDQLKQYSINTLPPEDTWIDLIPGLQFRLSIEDDADSKKGKKENFITKVETFYDFKSKGPNAEKIIDDFIQVEKNIYVNCKACYFEIFTR